MSDESFGGLRVWRMVAILLMSRDAPALARFYREAFDFVDEASEPGRSHLLLGETRLWIEQVGPDAMPYPGEVPGWSPLFQHFAIRVTDMEAAMARLACMEGWRPISTQGPQTLPPNAGRVTAFKFRDPEGHPLEFLAFPAGTSGPLFAGIDHTAISVTDLAPSIAFYEALGLTVAGRTLNGGIEQERLDGIVDATVDVVGMRTPSGEAPHLELLRYRGRPADEAPARAGRGDIVATTVLYAARSGVDAGPGARVSLEDPSLHHLSIGY